LGTGSFGAVYKGLRKKDGLAVAVKIIDLESTNEDMGGYTTLPYTQ
jgi:serine/threonine protein kinase